MKSLGVKVYVAPVSLRSSAGLRVCGRNLGSRFFANSLRSKQGILFLRIIRGKSCS